MQITVAARPRTFGGQRDEATRPGVNGGCTDTLNNHSSSRASAAEKGRERTCCLGGRTGRAAFLSHSGNVRGPPTSQEKRGARVVSGAARVCSVTLCGAGGHGRTGRSVGRAESARRQESDQRLLHARTHCFESICRQCLCRRRRRAVQLFCSVRSVLRPPPLLGRAGGQSRQPGGWFHAATRYRNARHPLHARLHAHFPGPPFSEMLAALLDAASIANAPKQKRIKKEIHLSIMTIWALTFLDGCNFYKKIDFLYLSYSWQ